MLLQLLAELRQPLIGFQEAFLQQTRFTGAITASAVAEHPAEDEAGNQPGKDAGDEQKGGSHRTEEPFPSGCIDGQALGSLIRGRPQ